MDFLIKKKVIILLPAVMISLMAFSQSTKFFIIDSIPLHTFPNQKLNNLQKEDIHTMQVLTDKDSLRKFGVESADTAIFITTNAYYTRPAELKKIPSVNIMEQKSGRWFLAGSGEPYTGPFINYYLSGDKLGEGHFKNGRLDGKRTMYYENQQVKLIRHYKEGLEDGWDKEYYPDGILKQQGNFIEGKEDGKWEMHFPNGQLKQVSHFENGKLVGEGISYYSTGKIKSREKIENGKPIIDPEKRKVLTFYDEGFENAMLGNLNAAIKSYTRSINLDPGFAEGYFARGTAYLNNLQFELAKSDFDKAIIIEPYFIEAYANRAFCLIRKYQLQHSKKAASKKGNDQVNIPGEDLTIICSDLDKTISLGNNSQLIIGAHREFCQKKLN